MNIPKVLDTVVNNDLCIAVYYVLLPVFQKLLRLSRIKIAFKFLIIENLFLFNDTYSYL